MSYLKHKKLYLVLDLDHTLLHTIHLSQLTKEERSTFAQKVGFPDSVKYSLHMMNGNILTKLRPFVHSFLREASKLFDMYVCTLGTRPYALRMLRLLDPDNVYFKDDSRVITSEDCPGGVKSLDIFLRNKDAAVVILDDTKEVWKNRRNLIVAEKYHYFEESFKYYNTDESLRAYSVSKTDESESRGMLAKALAVLKRLHAEFFDVTDQEELEHKDVRLLPRSMSGR